MEENWQIKIFRKSLKKKERVEKLTSKLSNLEEKKCLELGCARGIIGYHLRKLGGKWVSVDTDMLNLVTAKQLLQDGIILANPLKLPFHDETFDLIAALDILEHLENDDQCFDEIKRLLKPGGKAIFSAPTTGKWFIANKLKQLIGLKPSLYGHVREGYEPQILSARLTEKGFNIQSVETFTGFFTETLEMLINFFYIRLMGRKKRVTKRDGVISPSSENEFKKYNKIFWVYSFLYPITWLVSRLDLLLFFLKGYTLIIEARK